MSREVEEDEYENEVARPQGQGDYSENQVEKQCEPIKDDPQML
jgi:hypothetical protein